VKFVKPISAFLCFSAIATSAVAVDTPDDTYFSCGVFLIAMETSWKQRIENKFEDRSATVRTGFQKLESGKPANDLNPQAKGVAYPDRIELWTGNESKIDRRTAVLSRKEHRPINGREILDGTYEPYVWRTYPCEIVSKKELDALIDAHNEPLGGLKF